MNSTYRAPIWESVGSDVSNMKKLSAVLESSGIDWEVEVRAALNPVTMEPDYDIRLPIRMDTGKALGSVGSYYKPPQHSDIFAWTERAVKSGDLEYVAAGEIFEGRRVWLLTKLVGSDIKIGKNETITPYLLCSVIHDGSAVPAVRVLMVREDCQSTFTVDIDNKHNIKVTDIAKTYAELDSDAKVKELLSKVREYCQGFKHVIPFLINTKMSESDFVAMLDDIYPIPQIKEPSMFKKDGTLDRAASMSRSNKVAGQTRVQNHRNTLLDLFLHGERSDDLNYTAWAAFHAVVEYSDWERECKIPTSRSGSGDRATVSEYRLARTWMKPQKLKTKVLDYLLLQSTEKAA